MLQLVRKHREHPTNFMNDFFNDDFFNFNPAFESNFLNSNSPAINVEETEKEFVIDVAAPGIDKKDFKVSVDNDVLTISTKNKDEKNNQKDGYIRREFNYNSFSRSFTLPENTEAKNIKASHYNGVLNIHIPKAEVTVQKAINIKVA